MKKYFAFLVVICLLVAWPVAAAYAHGVDITYGSTSAIQLTAKYDTGEPVSEGDVVIYAPNEPATPWSTGKSDENGSFTFTPDPALQGTWDVQVRKAGHGGMVHIPVEGSAVQSVSTGFTTAQVVIMSASVIWGLVGTALYFSRRKS
ncbi:MAG: hypothetical protein JL56_13135 [Desulfotomaculum sp. BICA1-6]|nr:MAG: hypothetical protein VR67_13165 [Peptococcaceae bacterium BRH_c8a]KJS72463.1 MAG: hypothetical protein JL56_13135 [Desulfotomaculum sp. BICA1-6]